MVTICSMYHVDKSFENHYLFLISQLRCLQLEYGTSTEREFQEE